MHWLLLLVRFILRCISGDEGTRVALAARIDGRLEQRRRTDPLDEAGWWLLAFWRRRNRSGGSSLPRKRHGVTGRNIPPHSAQGPTRRA